MALRFIPYTRVGMQRPGLLAAACAASENRRPADADRVAATLKGLVARQVAVPEEFRAQAEDYLAGLRLWQRYRSVRGRELTDADLLEAQDVWLADPALPAATGALTQENAIETPLLAVSLRLLREGNFTRTDRGRALLLAFGAERVGGLSAGTPRPNPFELPAGAQLLVLYSLMEADGDFLQSLWRIALGLANSDSDRPRGAVPHAELDTADFTRRHLSLTLGAACADLRSRARRRSRTGSDQQLLLRLAEWEQAVSEEPKSGSEWGGGRPPDQMATLRLEPFVDCGIIGRRSRYAYRYELSAAQRQFLNSFAEADDVGAFAIDSLVSGWLAAQGSEAIYADEETIWHAVRGAYGDLRSSLGFAAFNEVLLVAVGRLLDRQPAQWFELRDGIDLLHQRRRESPRQVRLGMNQAGELTYMKLSGPARQR